ncbi:DeoR/GlpR family DNA-binding transcription regulator [Thermophilibacter immobilis]|jgi:DeoR/GlpR family transcriptional regulator of sugar metabolism|uniref:Lactose phosphotransferase system repressor n=1 Tax=Thermophilibacter immobilis TaxID=2779519 RepID=A0A7S7M7N9_9ACTN|nr:DeoR/GlpR family DNA-binding transcription regulator [Thermophilibacter immobilis]QOY60291.1 DeoR/GlpR transcriptional regulator [Thermophilibacter immobilis]
MPARANRILEILTERTRVEVAELAARLGVSQVTMRKDLADLESRGLIKREHGLAFLQSTDNVEGRLAYHYEEKLKIARRAIEYVHDGDTIMIESGSCCALLAAQLADAFHNVTIITNSAFIAGYVRKSNNVQTILLGGIYQKDSQVMVGPLVSHCVEGFYVDLLFVGTDGHSERTGFTNSDQMRAQAVHDMAIHAERVMVLTESEKFSRRGTVPLDLGERPVTAITDNRIPKDARAKLARKGIELVTA